MTDALNLSIRNHSIEPLSSAPRARRIALTGFMGCGKSTVARLLARQIGWVHVDLDKRIVERANLAIPDIFSQLGEPSFRDMEHKELKHILGKAVESLQPTVVSLGGGTMAQSQNVEVLRLAGCPTVWLECRIEELLRRCSHITDRPLFRDENSFRQLYAQRLPYYRLADHRVDSSIEALRVVQDIIALGILEGVPA